MKFLVQEPKQGVRRKHQHTPCLKYNEVRFPFPEYVQILFKFRYNSPQV
jgi:hypothetical protein